MKERPPVFGMMQRGGQVVINLLANVQQKTIEPFIKDTIVPGTLVYTDEYSIYARLPSWGYSHKSVYRVTVIMRQQFADTVCSPSQSPLIALFNHRCGRFRVDLRGFEFRMAEKLLDLL